MELVGHFINAYSDNFIVALALWPLASGVLSIPIIALIYHREGCIRLNTVAYSYLSVLYALSLVCFTLYPLPSGESGLGITYGIDPQLNPLGFIYDISKDGIGAIPQILANIAFFIPLGFLAGRLLRVPLFHSLFLGFVVSLVIEIAQLTGLFFLYPYSYRTFDVCDLMWNTLGTAIGWGLSCALGKVLPARKQDEIGLTHNPGFIRRVTAFCLDMTLIGFFSYLVGCITELILLVSGIDERIALTLTTTASFIAGISSFILVQGVIPWFNHGSTPGGKFVRMSFETAPRSGLLRVAFYASRLIIIAASFQISYIAFPVLALFYLIKRCMPYDLFPCQSNYQKYQEYLKAQKHGSLQSEKMSF